MGDTEVMSATPHTFDDSLAVRGWQNRRGAIGNPFAYLNEVGIEAVLEKLYQGANLVDAAEALKVSITVLRKWLDVEGHWPRMEEAATLSSEGYLSEGRRMLKAATTSQEINKAKTMLEHARWLAGKLNKPVYGTSEVAAAATTVSFTFNIGGQQLTVGATTRQANVIEHDIYHPPLQIEVAGAAIPDTGPFDDMPDPRELDFQTMWQEQPE